MLKVKVIASNNAAELEREVNAFISDETAVRDIISIQYQPMWYPTHYKNGQIDRIDICDRVLITYKDYVTLDDI